MAKVMVLKQNYADADLLVSQTFSSQLTIAPATNVLAKTRRTKVWRTAGYWNITSSNNVLKFKETSAGTLLTATIAVAQYLTDATFLAAIKAALEVNGDSTYTVIRDVTTKKIKITSNGSGGGGVFQLFCTDVGFTAASILGFSTGSDLTGALFYIADVLKIHTSEWIRWDLGTSSNVQAFIAIGLQNEGLQLSSSAIVTIMGNTTDAWDTPQFSQTLDWNEDAIGAFNMDGFFPSGLRYWKMEIEDPSNPDGFLELSNIYLGEIYTTTQGAVQFPLQTDFIDVSKTEYSETGVGFSNTIQQTNQYTLPWYALTKIENEELEEFIKIFGTSYPFFISLDPGAIFSSSVGKWIKYCRFSSQPTGKLELPNLFSMSWVLREEL